MSRLIALYPAVWRARYEEEFLALLAERPPASMRDRLDVVRGAVDARLQPQVPGPERVPDRVGYGVLAGFGVFWAAIALAASGPVQRDEFGTYRDGAAALPFLILSLALFSAGLYRIVRQLPGDAGWARFAGSAAIVAGPLWAAAPWILPAGVVFLLGTLALVVGARKAGVVPTWSLVIVASAMAIPGALFVAAMFLPWYALRTSGIEAVVVIAPLSLIWLAIGGTLLRGFAPRGGELRAPSS